jgi:hypothetical protein
MPSLAAIVSLFNISVDQGSTTLSPNAKRGQLGIKCGEMNFEIFLNKATLPNGIYHSSFA